MTAPTDRNGEIPTGSESGIPDSPKNSPKMVVFRSKDAELRLVRTAGYTDKSHGQAEYHPTTGVQFVDFMLRVEDTQKNKGILEWLRKHESNGISFREIPETIEKTALPKIAEMRVMSIRQLMDLCRERNIDVREDIGQDAIILALIENQ
jgi:hypothetical protein